MIGILCAYIYIYVTADIFINSGSYIIDIFYSTIEPFFEDLLFATSAMGNIQTTEGWLDFTKYTNDTISSNIINKWILPTTDYSLKILNNYFEQYRQYVKHNPLLISEIESALYWISYLLFSKLES